MQIHVSKDGQQLGPFTWEQVQEQLAAGTIVPTDYAWHEGLGEWTALSELASNMIQNQQQINAGKAHKNSLSRWWVEGLDYEDWVALLLNAGVLFFILALGWVFYDVATYEKINKKSTIDRNPQSEVPVTDLGYPVNWETMSEKEKDKWLKWRIEQGIPLRNPFAKPLVRPTEIKFKLANKHLEKALNGGPCETLKDVKSLTGLDVNWHEDGFEDLNQMPNLETLALGGNSSSLIDDNIAELCEQKLPNLEFLIVPRTPKITISSVKMVITAFPSVSKISVMGCPKISQEECEALEKIHPNLKIWGDWNLDFGE
jgi:hypothetical protein